MTPLAARIFKADPFYKTLEGAHFYDVSAIYSEALSAVSGLVSQIKDSGEDIVLKLPFQKVWMEFRHEDNKGRSAIVFEQHPEGVLISTVIGYDSQPNAIGDYQLVRLPNGSLNSVQAYEEACSALGKNVTASTAIFAVVLLLFVNTPRAFVQVQRRNRAVYRANKSNAANRPWTLGAWTEIKLEVNPDTVRELGGEQPKISGKKALHWVRGHWRKVFGDTLRVWVRPHVRGDASLGICQRRYNAEIAKRGPFRNAGTAAIIIQKETPYYIN